MAGHLQNLHRHFLSGLFVVLPLVLSLWLLYFFFEWVTRVTGKLLLLLPPHPEHIFLRSDGSTPTLAGRVLTFALAVLVLILLGAITRSFAGKDMVRRMETIIGRVPLLNKVYPTVRGISGTFDPDRAAAFREAVMVEFPKEGSFAIGFVTSETAGEKLGATSEPLISVFVPTAPNPTTGFLLMLPRSKVKSLKITVADAFKLVISGGTAKPASDENPAKAAAPSGKTSLS